MAGKATTLEKVLQDTSRFVERSPIPISLNPGLTSTKLKRLSSKLPFPLPKEVATVYHWRNGCSGTLSLIPEFQFMPFEDVVMWIKGSSRLYPEGWLPMFTNGGGDFLYRDARSTSDVGIFFWLAEAQQEGLLAFDSLEKLFLTISEAYRQKVFEVRKVSSSVNTVSGSHRVVTREVTEARDAKSWSDLKRTLNPISAKDDDAYEPIGVPEIIAVHMEELRRNGELKTELPARERRKERNEIDYVIRTMTRQLKEMKNIASSEDCERVQAGLENLKKLKAVLSA